MRVHLCFAIILAFWSQLASAQFFNGNKVVEFCNSHKEIVSAYIAGATDVAERASTRIFLFTFALSEDESKRHLELLNKMHHDIQGYCTPKEATLGQMTDVYCTYLNTHPADRHEAAATLLNKSFQLAWPCTSTTKK